VLKAVGHKAWSTHHALGLRCTPDNLRDVRSAKVAVRMKHASGASLLADIERELASAESDDAVELVNRRRLCERDVQALYVARSESGDAMYVQWLVGQGEQDLLHAAYPNLFPHLGDREFLVEAAYTFAAFRRLGVMIDGMRQLLAASYELGATSVLTYVSFGNIGSLRGCAAVGFEPDHLRVTTQRMGRRASAYVPLDDEAHSEWRAAVPAE
jgi:hypothetical protein